MEERYMELFQNVYGAKNEHPLNKIEEKREEIKDICEKHKYNHKNLQTALRALYAKRHQEYINTESA